jgi:hypothetical protein
MVTFVNMGYQQTGLKCLDVKIAYRLEHVISLDNNQLLFWYYSDYFWIQNKFETGKFPRHVAVCTTSPNLIKHRSRDQKLLLIVMK